MFDIKRKNLFYILLIFSLLIKLSLQQFIFPININFDDDDDEEEEEKESKEITYDDGVKPVYEKKAYKYYDNGTPVTVTEISYKSGNLVGNNNNNKGRGLLTPFDIMRNFDRRLNSIFDDFFRESIGIRHILSEMDKDEDEFEKRIAKDFFGDDNNDNNNNKLANNKEDIDNNEKKEEGDDNKLKPKEKNVKRFGKLNIDEEKMKNVMNKKRKKLSKKQLIFSRVCKYIFYSIVLFTIYFLVKKLLQFLDIIDPDDFIEVKINNEPDEESINLKKSENKQN